MTPRLSESKKWTAFPQELLSQVKELFEENFAHRLGKADLFFEGRIYPKEICFRAGFKEPGRLVQNNFEVSINVSQKMKVADQISLCVDAAASMMTSFFENPDPLEFPQSWAKYPFEGHEVYLQFNRENSDLERQADRILGLSSDEEDSRLVKGASEEDEED